VHRASGAEISNNPGNAISHLVREIAILGAGKALGGAPRRATAGAFVAPWWPVRSPVIAILGIGLKERELQDRIGSR